MDLSVFVPRSQRVLVLALMVGTSLALWTRAPDTFGLPKATILWIGAIALLGLELVRAVWSRELAVPRSPWALALGAFVVAVIVTTLASPHLALSIVGEYTRYTGLLSYLAVAVTALVVLRTFDVDEAAFALRTLAALAGVVATYGVLQWLKTDPIDWPGVSDGVAIGTLGNTDLFAGFVGIGTAAAAWTALSGTNSRRVRWAACLAALVALVGTVASRSFQGPAAAVPGLLFVVGVWATTDDGVAARGRIATRLGAGRTALRAVAGVIVAAGAVAAVVFMRSALRNGLVERGDFWRAALNMFRDRPVTGVGFDTYGQHFLAERPVGHAARFLFTQAESAHSVPLNLLAGGGALVALAWLALVVLTAWALVKGLRRLDGEERLLLGGLGGAWIAYLVQASVSFDVPELLLLHGILAASIVAVGAPSRWWRLGLPGQPPHVRGRGPRATLVAAPSTWVVAGVLSVVGLVGAWLVTRPLRADLDSGRAAREAKAAHADPALSSVEDATGLARWQGRYWLQRAQLSEAAQAVFDATDFAEEAARREPGSSQYALLAGRLNMKYRDDAHAARWFRAAVERDPNNPEVLGEVAAFEAKTDPVRARIHAEHAVAVAPNDYVAWYGMGAVEEADGDRAAALKAYERSFSIATNYPPTAAALARLRDGVADG